MFVDVWQINVGRGLRFIQFNSSNNPQVAKFTSQLIWMIFGGFSGCVCVYILQSSTDQLTGLRQLYWVETTSSIELRIVNCHKTRVWRGFVWLMNGIVFVTVDLHTYIDIIRSLEYTNWNTILRNWYQPVAPLTAITLTKLCRRLQINTSQYRLGEQFPS